MFIKHFVQVEGTSDAFSVIIITIVIYELNFFTRGIVPVFFSFRNKKAINISERLFLKGKEEQKMCSELLCQGQNWNTVIENSRHK